MGDGMAEPKADDGGLLASLAAGQPAALADLYDRYSALAFSLSLRMLGDASAAEDAVQDSFFALWRSATLYDGVRSTETAWVMRIVRHRCIDHLRHRVRVPQSVGSALLNELPSQGDVSADALGHLTGDEVRGALLRLPPEQREAVELAYFEGCTHTEIAERLGLPLGTVKGRIRLALRRLRELLVSNEL
jgi:RNA polymerase sigma-70 factor, ECF subfamily